LFNEAIFGYTVKSATKWETATGVEDDIYTNIRSNLATGASLVVNSDVVRVTRASSDTADLAGTIEELDDPIVVSAGSNLTFSKGDYVILSDCSSADVVRVSNEPDYTTDPTADVSLEHAVGTDANTVATLSKFYPASAQVRRFNSNFYYVAETGREDTAGNPVRALYRLPFGGEPVELVQGVESLQLLYGELLPTNLIRYSDVEDHSVDWARVVSVRISLLVSGSNAILAPGVSDDKTYTLAGVKIGSPSGSTAIKHPGDRKLRRVFSTTVNLYNKLASTNLAINSVVGP
jgi:type IV pilus assembly protein PilW